MQSFWDKQAVDILLERLDKLKDNAKPQWGKFTCDKMLAHVADGLRMALGKLEVAPKTSGPMRFWPFKQLVIYWLPFPKGVPTAPELLARSAVSIKKEKEDIKQLIEEFCKRSQEAEWPEHPIFGELTAQDWGVLAYRHTDHHLKQFGV